jgi:pimeloyl-ACP methyl ester carboxylesterase
MNRFNVISKYLAPGALASGFFAAVLSTAASMAPATLLGAAAMSYSGDAQAVACGSFDGHVCHGTASQYAGGFSPGVGYGGFGGAYSCTITHTPVVFIHGNGDNSTSWDSPTFQVSGYSKAPNSVYAQFKAAGYKDCELFGVTYLSSSEQGSPALNYHQESKYSIIQNFINKVKAYTGQSKVDVVTHSMGVSMSIAAFEYYGSWGSVRRFVNIAGGLHGLDSCEYTGYANPYATTCDSENWYDSWVFGFYPDNGNGLNDWTASNTSVSLSKAANRHTGTSFYTIYAGTNDEIMCATTSDYSICGNSPLLTNSYGNVKAQLNVGAGSNTSQVDWDWSDGMPWNVMGGDTNGVGHFHARSNTGVIIVNMLNTACTGTGCASGYSYGPVR